TADDPHGVAVGADLHFLDAPAHDLLLEVPPDHFDLRKLHRSAFLRDLGPPTRQVLATLGQPGVGFPRGPLFGFLLRPSHPTAEGPAPRVYRGRELLRV